MSEHEASRRNVLYGLAAVGVATPVLAACGSSGGDRTGTVSDSGDGGSSGIPTSEIPVGGGKIVGDVVVTQPAAGEFKAFSSRCTHQGCAVTKVADGLIDCPCHGSQFSIEDGSVQGGPAPSALPEKTVTVAGSTLTVS
ncbi:MAG: Rieske (2Fe-2S) protein [Nocardioidaceae bacterium]|nr:Rieske (2Fe-2S) protein [Nocardioidaceae bacterium]